MTGLAARSAGDKNGRPLVFVHGWAMSSAVWQKQLEHFAPRGYAVYAVDLPGHGDTPPPEGPLTIRRCGEALAGFLLRHHLTNAALVGWSLGSMAVCHAALLAPDRVSQIAIVAGTPRFSAAEGEESWGTPLAKGRWFGRQMRGSFGPALETFVMSFFSAEEGLPPKDAAWIKSLLLAKTPDTRAALELLDDLLAADIRAEVARLGVPSLILHGQDDRIIPSGVTKVWSALLASSATALLPGCGHLPFLTRRGVFNDRLEGFLRDGPGRED